MEGNIFLLFLESTLNTKQDTAQERTHLFVFVKCIKKNWGKKRWTCRWEKIKKKKTIEENKLTVVIKRLLWEFNMY